MQRYPAKFDPDDGGFVVSFRDIPEALTQGDTIEEAREAARDALLTAMDFGVQGFVPKPFDTAVMLDILADVLREPAPAVT